MLHAPGHGPSPSHGPGQLQAAQPGQNPEPRPMNPIKLAAIRSQSVIQVALPLDITPCGHERQAHDLLTTVWDSTPLCNPGTEQCGDITVLKHSSPLARRRQQTNFKRQAIPRHAFQKQEQLLSPRCWSAQASKLQSLYVSAPFDILSTSRSHSSGYRAPPATVTCTAKAQARVTAAPCCTAGNERHWP